MFDLFEVAAEAEAGLGWVGFVLISGYFMFNFSSFNNPGKSKTKTCNCIQNLLIVLIFYLFFFCMETYSSSCHKFVFLGDIFYVFKDRKYELIHFNLN